MQCYRFQHPSPAFLNELKVQIQMCRTILETYPVQHPLPEVMLPKGERPDRQVYGAERSKEYYEQITYQRHHPVLSAPPASLAALWRPGSPAG